LTSPVAVLEAVMALRRLGGVTVIEAERMVEDFLTAAGVSLVPIAGAEARAAIDTYAPFGKGQGHPAQLNLGDCFAYACARVRGIPLLFVGNDSARTDAPSALA
jgi:ribonuclease VapC